MEPIKLYIYNIYIERDIYIYIDRRDSGMYTLHNTELEERERT